MTRYLVQSEVWVVAEDEGTAKVSVSEALTTAGLEVQGLEVVSAEFRVTVGFTIQAEGGAAAKEYFADFLERAHDAFRRIGDVHITNGEPTWEGVSNEQPPAP